MDAVSKLKQHVDIVKVLEYYNFDRINTYGELVRAACKLHGGNNPSAFVFNTSNNLWYCHTGSCGGGDIYTLIQRLEKCSFTQAVSILAGILGVDINGLVIAERKEEYKREIESWVRFMKKAMENRSKEMSPYTYSCRSEETPESFRAFKKETLEHFGAKIAHDFVFFKRNGESFNVKRRLIVPVYVNGVQIAVSMRQIDEDDTLPKWLHQPANFKTSDVLYNLNSINPLEPLVICEGVFDVWAFYEIGVQATCTFGASISDEQYKLLLRTGCEEFVFAYDGDKAGRTGVNKAVRRFLGKAKISRIAFDEDKDPDSITREELLSCYDKRCKV